jgi:hypothetical protein
MNENGMIFRSSIFFAPNPANTAEYEGSPKVENLVAVIETISDRAHLETLLQAVMRRRSAL